MSRMMCVGPMNANGDDVSGAGNRVVEQVREMELVAV